MRVVVLGLGLTQTAPVSIGVLRAAIGKGPGCAEGVVDVAGVLWQKNDCGELIMGVSSRGPGVRSPARSAGAADVVRME